MAELIADKYEIVEVIGRGGMGTVYKAYQRGLDRFVAIKVLYENLADDPDFRARFQNEATIVAKLNHPNIVAVYDIVSHGKTYCIVMEYVDGQSLQKLVDNGALDERTALLIGAQIARALHYAHERGVIHRDVKPDNILVTPDKIAKITDFGIARMRGGKFRTQTGVSMGTPRFMSPEQVTGHDLDGRSDLYSLGVCLYYCLTGRVPFDGDNAFAVATRHIYEAPVPPSQINPSISPAAEQVIMKALEKNKDARFANGEEMAKALEEAASGKTAIVIAPTPEIKNVPQGETRKLDFSVGTSPAGPTPTQQPNTAEGAPRPQTTPLATPQFVDEMAEEAIAAHVTPATPSARNALQNWLYANWGIVAAIVLIVGTFLLLVVLSARDRHWGVGSDGGQGTMNQQTLAGNEYSKLVEEVERAIREGKRLEAVQRLEAFQKKYPEDHKVEIEQWLDRLTAALPVKETERLAKRRADKCKRLFYAKRYPLAKAYLSAALELNGGLGTDANIKFVESALKLLDQGTSAALEVNTVAAEEAYANALSCLKSNDAQRRLTAEKYFIDAICNAPQQYKYWLELARFYESDGLLDDARVLLRYIEGNAPNTSDVYQEAGRLLRKLQE
jgi:serine/threonine protein kinase